jgi:hypothetical protein
VGYAKVLSDRPTPYGSVQGQFGIMRIVEDEPDVVYVVGDHWLGRFSRDEIDTDGGDGFLYFSSAGRGYQCRTQFGSFTDNNGEDATCRYQKRYWTDGKWSDWEEFWLYENETKVEYWRNAWDETSTTPNDRPPRQ